MTRLSWIMLAAIAVLLVVLWQLNRQDEEGGATPHEVLERLAEAVESEAYDRFLPVVLPEQRTELAFGLGVSGPVGSAQLREQILPAAKVAGEAEYARTKAEVERLRRAHRAVLDEHGVPSYGFKQLMQAGTDPAARRALAKEALAGVDLSAFLRDVSALMARTPDGQPGAAGPFGTAHFLAMDVTEEGDTATASVPGAGKTLTLRRIEGRWYADLMGFQ